MSEKNKDVPLDILAKLRGVGTGGVSVSQPRFETKTDMSGQEQYEEKPKRDIKELYDFIDAYCSTEEN